MLGIFSILAVVFAANLNLISADTRAADPLKGSKLETDVDSPYGDRVVAEFPNNRDCIFFSVNAIKKDGGALTGEKMRIDLFNGAHLRDASSRAEIDAGNQSTGGGQTRYCLTSSEARKGTVTVKLANYPRTKKKFKVSFKPVGKVANTTDTGTFFGDQAVTFAAEIAPWMTNNIKEAKLVYSYRRRYNSWGRWKNRAETEEKALTCIDSRCEATIGGYKDGPTSLNRVSKGRFTYTFQFTDENGKSFKKSFRGKLKSP